MKLSELLPAAPGCRVRGGRDPEIAGISLDSRTVRDGFLFAALKGARADGCDFVDDAVARVMKTEGGILWALKNYDGDVMSDMVASACGSLAMMTSVLVSPNGWFEYEAAHGTVQKHYYKHLKGEETSSNSMALIFAWTGGLRKRGELDGTPAVIEFADALEAAALQTVEAGIMTGDLLLLAEKKPSNRKVNTEGFIDAIADKLKGII